MFAVLAYIYLKNFKPFYRFRLPITIVGFFVVCIVFGWMSLASGFAKVTNDTFDRHVPIYSRLMDRGADFWMDPDAGVLGGLVDEVDDAEHFIVIDPAGYTWKVEAAGCDPEKCQQPLAGHMVKMSGQRSEGDIFIAEMIRSRPASIHCQNHESERSYCPMRIRK